MMFNNNLSPKNDLIARYRQRLARAAMDYPTDPLSLILCVLGTICVLAITVVGSPWRYLLIGLLTLATGVVGLVTARGRYVLYTFRITIGGATVAMLAELVLFAPFTIWWLAALPLGAGLSVMVIYYYGAWAGLVWGAMQAGMAFVGVMLASTMPEANNALLLEGLVAGELIIILAHLALVLLMPEQTDIEKRNLALSQQRNELENMTSKIGATADGLSRASTAIHMVTSQQSGGAEQQAAAITQAVTMLTEFMAMADQVREQSRSVANLSEKTAEVSGSGQQAIRQTSEGMAHIRAQMTAIAHNIAALAQQLQRIDEIITSVGEIATQSNLLALNASIEAARAGTHGRGFAVVADEVRALAQESQDAAMQVQAILGEIQEAMKQTVRATQTGDQRVDEGLDLSRQAGMVITQLADNIAESTDAVRNIMASIDEQSVGLEQIVRSMQGIHEVTQQNLASNRTAETVAETLSGLSEELMAAVGEHTGEELYA